MVFEGHRGFICDEFALVKPVWDLKCDECFQIQHWRWPTNCYQPPMVASPVKAFEDRVTPHQPTIFVVVTTMQVNDNVLVLGRAAGEGTFHPSNARAPVADCTVEVIGNN